MTINERIIYFSIIIFLIKNEKIKQDKYYVIFFIYITVLTIICYKIDNINT